VWTARQPAGVEKEIRTSRKAGGTEAAQMAIESQKNGGLDLPET